MAQTQTNTSVQFHSISKANYDNLGQERETGALYFIKDNGEIRKGDKHITGTRVYTAVDSTNGATPLNELIILLNGSAPGENDQPKKGDILIVDQTLKAASGSDAAVIAKAAYAHNGIDWVACDGNVDASKVILTENIKLAGTYANVGNIERTGQDPMFNTSGKSVMDTLKEIFTKPLYPTSKQKPKVTVTMSKSESGSDFEVGTVITTTYKCSYSDGWYKYEGGSAQDAGCTVKDATWTVSGDATSGQNGKPPQGSAANLVAGTKNSVTVKAKVGYNAGTNTPKDNLGNDYTYTDAGDPPDTGKNIPFVEGETDEATGTVSITSYRKWFYLVLGNSDMVDAATDNTKIESGYLRQNGHGAKVSTTPPPTLSASQKFQQVLIFLPSSTYSGRKLAAKTQNNIDYTVSNGGSALSRQVTIAGAGNDVGVSYSIWEIKLDTPSEVSDNINLTWTNS